MRMSGKRHCRDLSGWFREFTELSEEPKFESIRPQWLPTAEVVPQLRPANLVPGNKPTFGRRGYAMPGKGLEPLRLQRRHLILSQARMTSFATPARQG
jgi:hypothetical protein